MQLSIDTGVRTPIYRQLVQQVREAIARGELRPEEKLPSVRQLARDLVINPNTIARAFTELEREGLIVSRAGVGIFVARREQQLTKKARKSRLLEMLDLWLTEAVNLGFSADEVLEIVTARAKDFAWQQSSGGG
ncbi:HTH-type transcriptional repressor YtrA [Planctomycetes bacterium Pan216]|uniref:HTH-type transcriptional repressor YtrA n=1 Tax=Kolteria novifilia TaxID=2527975 RepID=A0A518B1T3_9BACT|nr:HTH-type transcriptional repressor YtrA [Planctomycetes bacterium Pan216]